MTVVGFFSDRLLSEKGEFAALESFIQLLN